MSFTRGILLITLFIFIIPNLISQSYSQKRIPCEKSVYLLTYHFIKKPNFSPNIQNDVNELYIFTNYFNTVFEGACIEFKICKIDTIEDYNYFNVMDDPKVREYLDILNIYYDNSAINIYWVGDRKDQTNFGICSTPSQKPSIFLPFDKAIDRALGLAANQMLRYFGLIPTTSYPGSIEYVNTTNGTLTADSTWDTPADPYAITASPDTVYGPLFIPYYYTTKRDVNGDLYNPMIYNLMCDIYTEGKCTKLTHEQYQKLVINDRMCRRKRWGL